MMPLPHAQIRGPRYDSIEMERLFVPRYDVQWEWKMRKLSVSPIAGWPLIFSSLQASGDGGAAQQQAAAQGDYSQYYADYAAYYGGYAAASPYGAYGAYPGTLHFTIVKLR